MARVQLASQGFSPVVDSSGNAQPALAFTLTTLSGGAVTVYSAATGTTVLAAGEKVTASNGTLPGFVEEGTYTFAIGSVSERVEAVSGLGGLFKVDAPTGVAATDTANALRQIDACYDAGGGTVRFQPGMYLITSLARNWTISRSVVVEGSGELASVLQKSGGDTDPVLALSVTIASVQVVESEVRNLAIRGSGGPVSGQHGLKIDGAARLRLTNVDIRQCDHAVHNLGGIEVALSGCVFQSNNTGLYCRVSPQSAALTPNVVTVRDSQITNNSAWGVDYADGNMLLLGPGTDLEQNGTAANTSTGGLKSVPSGDGMTKIDGAYLESNLGWTIDVQAGDVFVSDTKCVTCESGRAVRLGGACKAVKLKGVIAPDGTDTLTATVYTTLDIDSCRFAADPVITFAGASDHVSIRNLGGHGSIVPVKRWVRTGTAGAPTNVPRNSLYVDDAAPTELRWKRSDGAVYTVGLTLVP